MSPRYLYQPMHILQMVNIYHMSVCLPCTVSLYPSIHLLIHPSSQTSIMKQMAFQEPLSELMASQCPGHTITTPSFHQHPQNTHPPTHTHMHSEAPPPHGLDFYYLLSSPMDHYLASWKIQVILFNTQWKHACSHEMVVKCVSSKFQYLWGWDYKEEPPNRAVCLWSLGPVKRDNWWCFHYKVWGNVGVGAPYECVCIVGVGRLTQLPLFWHPPLLCLVRTSLPNALIQTYTHALKESHTLTLLHTSTQRQMHTHKHTKSIPKDKLSETESKCWEKKLTCSLVCRSVSSQCHARPLADLSVSCLLGPLWNPNAVAPKILTAT